MTFSQIIKAKMDEREWSQADLVRASGMSEPQVHYLLTKTKDPRLSTLLLLAKVFNCSIDDFAPTED